MPRRVALFLLLGACAADPGTSNSRTPDPQVRDDRDGDRVPDICDDCPDEPENYNGCMDYDGCRDHCYPILEYTEADIEEAVAFSRGEVTWPPATTVVVDMVAAMLLGNPDVDELACVGTGDDGLGQVRAEAVCGALEERRVDPGRLVAREVTGSAPEVRFVIVSRDGTPRARWRGGGYEELPRPAPEPQRAPPAEPTRPARDSRGCPVRPVEDPRRTDAAATSSASG